MGSYKKSFQIKAYTKFNEELRDTKKETKNDSIR